MNNHFLFLFSNTFLQFSLLAISGNRWRMWFLSEYSEYSEKTNDPLVINTFDAHKTCIFAEAM